jgi:hypothetical protein
MTEKLGSITGKGIRGRYFFVSFSQIPDWLLGPKNSFTI